MPIWVCWIIVAALVVIFDCYCCRKGRFPDCRVQYLKQRGKRKVRRKRLRRVVGCGMGVSAAILGIATFYHFEMPAAISWLIPWGLLGTIVMIEVLAVTVCRKKPRAGDE